MSQFVNESCVGDSMEINIICLQGKSSKSWENIKVHGECVRY